MYKIILFFFLIGYPTIPLLAQNELLLSSDDMTIEKMDQIFRSEAQEVDGEDGVWQIFYGNRILFVLTDAPNNRMRIFTPIGGEEELEVGEEKLLLTANFHSALDAKYSLYNGFIVSVFTHPLKELTDYQLKDAMSQVVLLADNFGSTYSSTNLIFGFEEEAPDTLPEKRINQRPKKNN